MAKPKIRFNGYTEDWEQRKLGDVIEKLTSGASIAPDDYVDVGYRTIPKGAVNSSGVADMSGCKNVSENFFKKNISSKTSSGELVTSLRDLVPTAPNMGRIVRICGETEDFLMPQGVYSIIVKEKISEDFLITYSNSPEYRKIIMAEKNGSTQVHIRNGEFLNIDIPLPSYEEQMKIGEHFKTLDHLITLHQRKCEQTKTLKKYMLQKMFPQDGEKVPQIRFEGFTEDWEQRKFSDVAEYRNGKAHENEIDDDGEYIVVNSKFVSTNGEIKKFSNAQNEPLYENEIAFVLSDVPNGRAIARTFLIDKSGKYTLNQRIAGITPHKDTDPYYLHIKMNRNAYFLKFDDGNKQTNLSIKDVLNYEDMYPNYKEQQKIGNYFRSLDHLITLHQRKCDELKEVKKFMLQNMFV